MTSGGSQRDRSSDSAAAGVTCGRFFCGKSPDLSLQRNLSEITFSGIIARLIT